MQPTQTGIAVALALVVIVVIFLFPSLLPFGQSRTVNDSATQPVTTTDMNATSTELQMNDEVVGTGTPAEPGDSVTVNYVGSLTNGTVFDASAQHGTTGFTFTLGVGQVIKGWDEGIVGMKEGGKRMLVIPASLAYGDQAVGNVIPANSTLVFQVELLKVQKAK